MNEEITKEMIGTEINFMIYLENWRHYESNERAN